LTSYPDSAVTDDIEYAERFLQIIPKDVEFGLIPFVPNRAQRHLAAHWHNRIIILKARQLGMSTMVCARFLRKATNWPGVVAACVAHEAKGTHHIFDDIIKTMYENLPDGVRPVRKRNNVFMMTFPLLNSSMSAITSIQKGSGRGRGGTAGRAPTIHLLHASEYAFWVRPEQLIGMRQAVPRSPFTDIVVESTPNGASGAFYDLWHSAVRGIGGWKPVFYEWWWDDGYSIPLDPEEVIEYEADELALVERHGLTPEQIKWRREKLEEFESSGEHNRELFFQEYPEDPETCFLTSGNCFFDAPFLRTLKASAPAPLEERENGLRVFRYPEPGYEYVMGVDTAGFTGGDCCAFVVRDRRTNERVATLKNRDMAPFDLAEVACKTGIEYNTALITIERNGVGLSTVEKALELGYENLYWSVGQDGEPKACGWSTTSVSRPVMLADLRQEVADMADDVIDANLNDDRLIDEMLHFVKGVGIGAKAEAAPGENDDLVICDAICGQVKDVEGGGGAVY